VRGSPSFLIILLVIASCFRASCTAAQENAPKTFYKKDYASAPGAKGRDEVPGQNRRPLGGIASGRGDGGQSLTNPDSLATGGGSAVKGKRRVVISVFVNSKDRDHLQKVLNEVFRIHDEKWAFIHSVEHIGDYTSITPELEGELARRKILLRATTMPSADVTLTTSPAWIITTSEGSHIAQGIIDVHSFMNEFGDYEPKTYRKQNSKNKVEEF